MGHTASFLSAVAAVGFISSAALYAGPPPGKGGGGGGGGGADGGSTTFVPSIVYTYSSGNSTDMRLSNADGSAAVLAYRSSSSIPYADLSPRTSSGGLIAFSPGRRGDGNGRLLRWFYDSSGGVQFEPVLINGADKLPDNEGVVQEVEFSPDGTKIAYYISTETHGEIYVADLSDLTSVVPQVYNIGARLAHGLTWLTTGDRIAFYDCTTPCAEQYQVSTLDLGTGGVAAHMLEPNITDLDASRLDGGVLLSFSRPNYDMGFDHWGDGFSSKLTYPPRGKGGHFSCDNSKFIYDSYDARGRRGPTNIHTVGVGDVIYSKDSKIQVKDWMPGCPAT